MLGWLEFFTHALKLLRMIGITNVTLSCLTNMHRERIEYELKGKSTYVCVILRSPLLTRA